MEPTQIRPGSQTPAPPVLTDGALTPAAYERAPTLMAGDAAGSQGAVRVWQPDKQLHLHAVRHLLWGGLIGTVVSVLLLVDLWDLIHGYRRLHSIFGIVGMFYWVILGPMLLRDAWRLKRRPMYITTDEAGIGITTAKGSRALRWSEIHSLHSGGGTDGICSLVLEVPERLVVRLAGYQPQDQRDLTWLIRQQARLFDYDAKRDVFRREPCPSLAGPGDAGQISA